MRYITIIFLLTGLLFSCRTEHTGHPEQETTEEITETEKAKPVWRVSGTEPFWGIYIHEDTVIYTRLQEQIDTIYFSRHHFSDQDSVVEFHLENPSRQEAQLWLHKGAAACSDGMSDRTYAYHATFTYRQEKLNGCAWME